MDLKELRITKGLTQKEAAEYADMPLRTYQNYENQVNKAGSIKYKYLINKLTEYGYVDENHGILDLDTIKKECTEVFERYDISFCYLFGSYAKDSANEKSDVDLLVSTTVTGLDFFGLVEDLRTRLKKKVDLLTVSQLTDNNNLVNEILKEGIKIYG